MYRQQCFNMYEIRTGLNTLVTKLDSRADEASAATSSRIQLKPRIESVLSTISPPQNAPSWTVDTTFQTPTGENSSLDLHDLDTVTPRRQQTDTSRRQLISTDSILDQLDE